jgi:hypothetical protein
LDLEQLEVGEGKGLERGAELLGAGLELLVELLELLLLLGELLERQLHRDLFIMTYKRN